jgi:hypothetical protein
VSKAEKAALDIMRSAGAEPTVGRALTATIVIGLTAPGTDPLIMTAVVMATWLRGGVVY